MKAAIIFLSISLLHAQGDRCSVKGTVVNAKTNEPVKRAQITLNRAGQTEAARWGALTNAAGQFELTNLDPGQYAIAASKEGFMVGARRLGDPPSMLTLAAGQTVKDLVFHLPPAAVIAGRVVDEDGDPLMHAQIQAFRYVYLEGRRQFVPQWSVETDDQGYYRIPGLAAGRYQVSAVYSDTLLADSAFAAHVPAEDYTPVYYPGVPDATQAAPLQLREGEERRAVDFRLTPVRTVRVRGRVTPSPLRPQEAVLLSLRNEGQPEAMPRLSMASPDEKGVFEFRGVTPGSYWLLAQAHREGAELRAHQLLEVGSSNWTELTWLSDRELS
jgi:protocatechuate 3,4-dioxygenase beta subunit